MTRLSLISASLLALSSQLICAIEVDPSSSSSSSSRNLRGVRMRTIDGDDEPKTSSLERALENQSESVFSPDFDIIPSPRIVNGGRATRGRYPYYVSIYTDSWWGPPSHSCGGSLIAPDVVLCAGKDAHVLS